MLVHTWGRMPSYMGYYPCFSVNTWRYGKHHQGVPLLGNTSVKINKLPPSKYQHLKVQLITSELQWVSDTCWSVTLPIIQGHLIPAWICMSMAYTHLYNYWSPYYLLQVNYQHCQLRSLNNQHSWWTKRPSLNCILSKLAPRYWSGGPKPSVNR